MPLLLLNACADISGEKLNFELAFNTYGHMAPSVEEVHARIVEVFSQAQRELTGQARPFVVEQITAFDSTQRAWLMLEASEQLVDGMQLYVFQPGHTATDLSRPLPAPLIPPPAIRPMPVPARTSSSLGTTRSRSPRAASQSRTAGSSSVPRGKSPWRQTPTPRYRSVSPPVSDDAANRSNRHDYSPRSRRELSLRLFSLLDRDRDGVVTLGDLRDAMLRHTMDVSEANVGDTFLYGDRPLTASDFLGFGDYYPHIVEALVDRVSSEQHVAAPPPPPPPAVLPPARPPSPEIIERAMTPPRHRPPALMPHLHRSPPRRGAMLPSQLSAMPLSPAVGHDVASRSLRGGRAGTSELEAQLRLEDEEAQLIRRLDLIRSQKQLFNTTVDHRF